MDIKEYFRQRLDEAIRADKTSRQTQHRIRRARGLNAKGQNKISSSDHPGFDALDPYNRVRYRNKPVRAGMSAAKGFQTAMKAEFGGTDPVYEAVKKLIKKKKATSGDTDASY